MNNFISQEMIQDAENFDQTKISPNLPLLPVRDIVLFRNMLLPIFVSHDTTKVAVEKAAKDYNLYIFVVT